MELIATWWPAALAFLVCLVLAMILAAVTASVFDDEVSGSGPQMAVVLAMYGAPVAAAMLVGPSPDPSTVLVGVLSVVAGLGVWFVSIGHLADRYLGPAWNGTRTRVRVWVATALALGAAIAAILVLGWWLPSALGTTTALVVTGAAVLAEVGLVAA